jgi:hypothetical protein
MTTANQTPGHDTTDHQPTEAQTALVDLHKTLLLDDVLWDESSPGIAINRVLATIRERAKMPAQQPTGRDTTHAHDEHLDLDVIRARADAATDGSWIAADQPHGEWFGIQDQWSALGSMVAQADAEFIAHARTDVPALVAEVERLRAEVERLRDPLRPATDDDNSAATWTSGWQSLQKMTRRQAIDTCTALVDMRDRAIRRYEGAEAERDEARVVLCAVAALADGPVTVDGHLRSANGDLFISAAAIRARLAPVSGAVAKHEQEVRAAALREAADRMPAFHDRDVPEWAITSACKWLRARADALTEANDSSAHPLHQQRDGDRDDHHDDHELGRPQSRHATNVAAPGPGSDRNGSPDVASTTTGPDHG